MFLKKRGLHFWRADAYNKKNQCIRLSLIHIFMDDGYPPVSILILIGFILLEAMFYGFGSAIQNVNEGKLEEEAAGGNKKAARLLEIVNRPVRFVHTIQVTTHLMGMIIGAAILPAMIGMVERRFLLGKVLAWAEPDVYKRQSFHLT